MLASSSMEDPLTSRRAPGTRAVSASQVAGGAQGHPGYRPDIDGLRAVAVLSVVCFHAFPGTVKGGFVGVDVFFVISGFLISTILFGNLARDRFDLLAFYVRRVRRIFPALLAVMVVSFAFGWFTLMNDEYGQLGKQLAAGAGFVANLLFWQQSGYFDGSADTKPFLHLWSLGVEEQFYLLWPLLLWATWRLKIAPLANTAVAMIVSFAINVYLATTDPVADFYSPVTRLWELSLGSVLACVTVSDRSWTGRLSPRQRDLQSLTGAALLVAALLLIDSHDVFPGWWALLPTSGALLLIASGSSAWVNRRVLSNRIMVWIGLISFPLYLWHWPILTFIRILASERPTRLVRIAAIVASVVLAWATWRYLETPLRTQVRNRWLPAGLVGAMVVVGGIGFFAYLNDGFAFRSAADVAIVNEGELGQEDYFRYSAAHFPLCQPIALRDEAERWDGTIRCLQSRDGHPDLAIIGDSHAEHLFVGLAEALPTRNVVFYARSSLPAASNPDFEHIFATVVADPRIGTVVLSAWWGLRFGELPLGTSPRAALRATLAPLLVAGKSVHLVDDVPNFSFSPRLCKYRSSLLRVHRCADDSAFYGKQLRVYADLLDELASSSPGVHVIKASPYFCDASQCSMVLGNELLFRDSDHLSIRGSRYVGQRIVADHPALRAVPAP